MRNLKIDKAIEWALFILAVEIMVLFLLKPTVSNFFTYKKYKQLTAQSTTVNASVRAIDLKKPIIGSCSLKIGYDFLVGGEIYKSSDHISCDQIGKVVIGNTINVFYEPSKPQRSISEISVASKKLELFSNTLFGLIFTILVVFTSYKLLHNQ